MTRPRPITDPHAGQYAVVVSFRLDTSAPSIDPLGITEHFQRLFVPVLIKPTWTVQDLDVAVRVVGAAGEASEMEGMGPRRQQ